MGGPVGCVAAVTYRCNARCAMCDIWRREPDRARELVPADYRWLPRSLRSVNLSGGEPFLRDDLAEIAAIVRASCPRARIVISTNGLSPERIEKMVSEMGDVAIRISIDAVGALHDEMRGVPGAYERAMETAHRLAALGVRDLGLAATSTELNPGQLSKIKALADGLGIEFIPTAAHSSAFFFGRHDAERPRSGLVVEEMGEIMRAELTSKRPRDWAKAYYSRGLIDYVRGRPRRLPCRAGTDFFFLDPWGQVYPCNILDVPMGNIRDGSFDELRRRASGRLRPAVRGCTEQCWMVCTVSPPMRRRPLGPLAWIAGAKLLGLGTGTGTRRGRGDRGATG
jgi:MoaA/NifB/PqqE/SkfB family radical SAM enzyme